MGCRTFWLLLILFYAVVIYQCSSVAEASEADDECIEPISDAELFKYYKPCNGGWCLRK